MQMHEENTTMEHESLLVRDVPQIDTLVTEAEDVNTSTVHKFESQDTKKDTEPIFDLKEDQEKQETETVISSDEVSIHNLHRYLIFSCAASFSV